MASTLEDGHFWTPCPLTRLLWATWLGIIGAVGVLSSIKTLKIGVLSERGQGVTLRGHKCANNLPCFFFFSFYSNQGKDRVSSLFSHPTSLSSSMSSLHVWGRVYALLHSKASVPFHWLLYSFVLITMSISKLWLYYGKAGYFQHRNVLLTCNENSTCILTG